MREELYRNKRWSSRNKTLYMEPGDEKIYIPKPLPEGPIPPGIYMGEGLMALKRIESDSVQAVFADPPYFGKQRPLDAAYPTFGKIIPHGLQHGLPKLTGS